MRIQQSLWWRRFTRRRWFIRRSYIPNQAQSCVPEPGGDVHTRHQIRCRLLRSGSSRPYISYKWLISVGGYSIFIPGSSCCIYINKKSHMHILHWVIWPPMAFYMKFHERNMPSYIPYHSTLIRRRACQIYYTLLYCPTGWLHTPRYKTWKG